MRDLVPGRVVHAVLPNGKIRPAIVVDVIEGSENGGIVANVQTLGKKDGFDNIVVQMTLRYSATDEDGTGQFPRHTYHSPFDDLQPKAEPVIEQPAAEPEAAPEGENAAAEPELPADDQNPPRGEGDGQGESETAGE